MRGRCRDGRRSWSTSRPHGDEVVIRRRTGARGDQPRRGRAVEAEITVEGLTLRTPTLDDVFLHVTGERMGTDKEAARRCSRHTSGHPRVTPRRAGFFDDLRSIVVARHAADVARPRGVPAGARHPVFFFVVNVGALQTFVEDSFPPGFDYKAFQLPVAVVFAVTGVSRATSLVIDIQNGYFDRLLLTPVRRVTLLLGLMSADVVLIVALATPVAARWA